jgi:lantibiotic modifying enzyme
MHRSVSDYLETADFIGSKLCRDAIWSGQRCNWFGVPVRTTQRSVELEAQSMCASDFYSGTSGIAFFLARLFAATGEKIFRITAEGGIRQALSRLDDFPRDSRIGFDRGLTGVAYSLFEIAESCGVEKFIDMGLLIMEEVASDEATRTQFGVSSSTATVAQLLRMYQRHQRDLLLRLATKCGEELLRQLHEPSISWQPLSVASAMLELFKVTDQKQYREAAEQILVKGPEPSTEHVGYGAYNEPKCGDPNNAIARVNLRAFEVLRENIYFTRARRVIETIQSRVESCSDEDVDFSLAQGLTGQGELLIEAGRILADERLLRTAQRIGNLGIERYKEGDLPWPCGSATGWDVPSLMIGVAGIGYFYLRLHDDSRVPSLLFA